MYSQPSLAGQPEPQPSRNIVKKDLRTILILVFMVVIVILLTFAVVLSGRSISKTQPSTLTPTPTPTPTATQALASSVTAVSVGLVKPRKPEHGVKTDFALTLTAWYLASPFQ